MSNFKKLGKCILLYGTLIYFAIIAMAADSIMEKSIYLAIGAVVILIILLCACLVVFEHEDLDDYVPKFFR